jgi:hypothetical protein
VLSFRPTNRQGEQNKFTLARVPGGLKGRSLRIGPVALRQRLDRKQACAYYPQESRENDHTMANTKPCNFSSLHNESIILLNWRTNILAAQADKVFYRVDAPHHRIVARLLWPARARSSDPSMSAPGVSGRSLEQAPHRKFLRPPAEHPHWSDCELKMVGGFTADKCHEPTSPAAQGGRPT